jgi:cytoskeleton protein RodZ
MTIGNQLKKARQKKQVTIKEAYERTRIHPDVLSALEEDGFHKIPNPVYAKSFLKEYALYLGLEANSLLKEYSDIIAEKDGIDADSDEKEKSIADVQAGSDVIEKHSSIHILRPALFGVLIVALAVFSVKVLNNVRAGFLSWNRQRIEQVQARKAESSRTKQEKPAPQIPAVRPADKPVEKETVISIPKNEKLNLSINVTDNVWIELKRDGDIVFKAELPKGTVRNWQADESFELWTGNASAMDLTLNGYNLGSPGRGVKKGVIIDRQGLRR